MSPLTRFLPRTTIDHSMVQGFCMKKQFFPASVIICFCLLFVVTGCATQSNAYQLDPAESNSASISFKTGNPSIRFVSFELSHILLILIRIWDIKDKRTPALRFE